MCKNVKIVPAIFKRNSGKIRCKLALVDFEVFYCAYYLMRGRLHILGVTKCHASLMVTPRADVITLTEKDWKIVHKAKPLVTRMTNHYYETKGLRLFEDTESKINLI